MDADWAWKDLAVIVPGVASSFAFTYVVGYFYAYDIAWFPFFSFSEHLVFALRALPIAIVASVCFLIALRFSNLKSQLKWFQRIRNWFGYGWPLILVAMGVYTFANNHVGLAMSFWLIAVGAYIYQKTDAPTFHKISASTVRLVHILYWATTLMVLSLLTGFASGLSAKYNTSMLFPIIRSMTVVYDKPDKDSIFTGHVISAGSVGVLFYDYSQNKVRLVRKERIHEIFECDPECSLNAHQN